MVLVAVALLIGGSIVGVAAELDPSAHARQATSELTGPPGPEGVPLQVGTLLAPASTAATGQTVDGVACDPSEQVAYHVHTHLSVYVNGSLRPIPAGVGVVRPVAERTASGPFYVATSCYYWRHVHARTGSSTSSHRARARTPLDGSSLSGASR